MPRKWRGKLYEWGTTATDRRNWKLLTENIGKEKMTKNTTVTMATLTPDDRDAKRRTATLRQQIS